MSAVGLNLPFEKWQLKSYLAGKSSLELLGVLTRELLLIAKPTHMFWGHSIKSALMLCIPFKKEHKKLFRKQLN
jgi:hypothetical protein